MYDVYYSITALTTVIDVLCKIVHNKFGEIQRITVVITELLLKSLSKVYRTMRMIKIKIDYNRKRALMSTLPQLAMADIDELRLSKSGDTQYACATKIPVSEIELDKYGNPA